MKTKEMTTSQLQRPAIANENNANATNADKQRQPTKAGQGTKYQRPNYLLRLL